MNITGATVAVKGPKGEAMATRVAVQVSAKERGRIVIEFAGFELMTSYIGTSKQIEKFAGGYVRDALKRGLEMENQVGVNPYKLGFVAGSDSHNAAGPYEEDHYFSKVGVLDGDIYGPSLPRLIRRRPRRPGSGPCPCRRPAHTRPAPVRTRWRSPRRPRTWGRRG